jgi:hypothetical protein
MSERASILRSIRSAAKRREKAHAAKREATEDLRALLRGSPRDGRPDHPDC